VTFLSSCTYKLSAYYYPSLFGDGHARCAQCTAVRLWGPAPPPFFSRRSAKQKKAKAVQQRCYSPPPLACVFSGYPVCISPVSRLYPVSSYILPAYRVLGISLCPCTLYLCLSIISSYSYFAADPLYAAAVSLFFQLYPYVSSVSSAVSAVSCIPYPAVSHRILPSVTVSKTGYGQKYTPGARRGKGFL